MTLVTPSLVFLLVSIASTLIHIRQTLLLRSTTLSVIRVLHLMTQVCSIAHTFLCRWYVPSVRTTSSQKLDLRLATVLLLTHSQTMVLLQAQLRQLPPTVTVTTREYKSRTSCDPFSQGFSEGPLDPLFFI